MKRIRSCAFVLLFICMSCRSLSLSARKWTYGAPPGKGPWARVLPELTLRSATLEQVCAEIQKAANAQAGAQVSVSMRDLPYHEQAITLNLRSVTLSDALGYVAEVSNTELRFAGKAVEFVPYRHRGCALWIRVICRGHAIDANTGKGLERFILLASNGCMDRLLVVTAGQDGNYEQELWVSAEETERVDDRGVSREVAIVRQSLHLDVSSPGYLWARHELAIEPTNAVYQLDIRLTPANAGDAKGR